MAFSIKTAIKWLIAVAVVALLIVAKYRYFPKNNPAPAAAAPNAAAGTAMPVNITLAGEEILDNALFATGTLLASEEVELHPEVSGRVIKLYLPEGKVVDAGTLLVKLNDADLQAQLKKVGYEEQLAKTNEERLRKLRELSAIGQDEYDLAANKLLALSAERELLQAQIAKTELRAPFRGTLGFKQISEGAYITPQSLVATITQMQSLKVEFSLPERYASVLSVGSKLTFEVEGAPDKFSATLSAIAPEIDANTRSVVCRAICAGTSSKLIPGAFAKVHLSAAQQARGVVLPSQVLIPTPKGKQVFVMKGGRVQALPVITGLRSEDKVQILGGVAVGDSVISSNLMALKAGMPVRAK